VRHRCIAVEIQGSDNRCTCARPVRFDLHRGSRRHEVAVKIAQRNRAMTRRRRGARDRPDFTRARPQLCTSCRDRTLDLQPHQFLRNASVPAMKDANDHFLADVAALGKRNPSLLDAGFERNGVFRHVDAEERIPCLDARGFEGGAIGFNRAGLMQPIEKSRLLRRRYIDAKTWDAQLVHACNHRRCSFELGSGVPIVGPLREPGESGHDALDRRGGVRPVQPDPVEAAGQISELNVLTE
jgi:hypothetical protein